MTPPALVRRSPRLMALVATFALMTGFAMVAGVDRAESLAPNTVWFQTEAQCIAGKWLYSGSFTRITQDCTYAGPLLFGFHTADGPWFLIYTARTN